MGPTKPLDAAWTEARVLITLALAAFAWIGVHVGIAGTLVRRLVADRIGDIAFRAIFSLLSVASISALIVSYNLARRGGPVTLWSAPAWLGWLLVAAMAPAFILLVASFVTPSPTAVGGERVLDREPRGMLRITRHPMLWAFSTWAGVHVIGNGDLASLLFFGAFGVTSLVGMPSIDRKVASRDQAGWSRFAAATSILPFAAIAAGRNRLALREIGWIVPIAGLALWLGLLISHPWIFGVSPLR